MSARSAHIDNGISYDRFELLIPTIASHTIMREFFQALFPPHDRRRSNTINFVIVVKIKVSERDAHNAQRREDRSPPVQSGAVDSSRRCTIRKT